MGSIKSHKNLQDLESCLKMCLIKQEIKLLMFVGHAWDLTKSNVNHSALLYVHVGLLILKSLHFYIQLIGGSI